MGTSRSQRNEGFNHSYDQKFRDQRAQGRGHGQGLGRGGFRGTYFHCNEEGNCAFEFPQWQGRIDRRANGQARFSHVDDDAQSLYLEDTKRGEVLVNERVLLRSETKPGQRRSLFCTRCKCEDKCCDVIVDGGNTDNLVSNSLS